MLMVIDFPSQRGIVAEIEAALTPVKANREVICRIETKITAAIDQVWSAGE